MADSLGTIQQSDVEANSLPPPPEAEPDRPGCEFVEGRWVEKNLGTKASRVAQKISTYLDLHALENKLGFVLDDDTGYQIFASEPKKVRKPDRSFVKLGRLPGDELPTGNMTIRPDLAIEVISPNDEADAVQQKVVEYLGAGVSLLWFCYPPTKTIIVYRSDRSAMLMLEGDELDGEDVVPGFRLALQDIFADV